LPNVRSERQDSLQGETEGKRRELTVGYVYIGDKPYPFIRLQGKWLENLGFSIRKRVIVEQRMGQIIITLKGDLSGE
jgi:hypothetical protein